MENQADKSQDATPYKLDEARKKGQVGKSVEFVSTASLIIMLLGLCFSIAKLGNLFAYNATLWLKNASQMAKSPRLTLQYFEQFAGSVFELLGVIMLLGMGMAILASLVHAGPVFSFFPLKLDFSKLNPVNGIKKIFSRRGLVEIFKLALKVVFFGAAMVFVWSQVRNQLLYPNSLSIKSILQNWKSALFVMLAALLFVYILFAIFDLWYSKREFAKKMRMSTRDIKDEYKRREGDPELKHKRKKNLINLIKNIGGTSKLKNADVIITNPTHFAVALQYRSKTMAFPVVIAKGRGIFAKFIIYKARRYGIPIYRRPPLARKIYKDSLVNSVIPLSEQQAVAEVYREIIKSPNSKVFS